MEEGECERKNYKEVGFHMHLQLHLGHLDDLLTQTLSMNVS